MSECTYIMAWRGHCQAVCDGELCVEHLKRKCVSCGEQATNECNHTGQFVCGAPLCDSCEGHTDTGKPSGGWGFMNHTHRRKEGATHD